MQNHAELIQGNADFAAHRFTPGLRMMPSSLTFVISCVDPRVDPAALLGLEPGAAAVIRNVGGRVTPAVVQELGLLQGVTASMGGVLGPGWNLVVLHHTDCGITRLADVPELLAPFFGLPENELDAKAVGDPRAAVAADVAALKADPAVPGGFLVSGLVYDVATGLVETVVEPAVLRG